VIGRIGLKRLDVGSLEDVVRDAVFISFGGLGVVENPSVVDDKLKAGVGQ
jgi:hypothetical protein